MRQDKKVYIWGCGDLIRRYINQITDDIYIEGVIDVNPEKWGMTDVLHNGKYLMCSSDELIEGDFVIIAIENPHIVEMIRLSLKDRKIECCHIFEVVDDGFIKSGKYKPDAKIAGPMVKFIDVMVPISKCNMKCEYCYLSHLDVKLDKSQEKINFLQVEWPYIYTLNIDDAVEKNSLIHNHHFKWWFDLAL